MEIPHVARAFHGLCKFMSRRSNPGMAEDGTAFGPFTADVWQTIQSHADPKTFVATLGVSHSLRALPTHKDYLRQLAAAVPGRRSYPFADKATLRQTLVDCLHASEGMARYAAHMRFNEYSVKTSNTGRFVFCKDNLYDMRRVGHNPAISFKKEGWRNLVCSRDEQWVFGCRMGHRAHLWSMTGGKPVERHLPWRYLRTCGIATFSYDSQALIAGFDHAPVTMYALDNSFEQQLPIGKLRYRELYGNCSPHFLLIDALADGALALPLGRDGARGPVIDLQGRMAYAGEGYCITASSWDQEVPYFRFWDLREQIPRARYFEGNLVCSSNGAECVVFRTHAPDLLRIWRRHGKPELVDVPESADDFWQRGRLSPDGRHFVGVRAFSLSALSLARPTSPVQVQLLARRSFDEQWQETDMFSQDGRYYFLAAGGAGQRGAEIRRWDLSTWPPTESHRRWTFGDSYSESSVDITDDDQFIIAYNHSGTRFYPVEDLFSDHDPDDPPVGSRPCGVNKPSAVL